jgi:hypothetical protein
VALSVQEYGISREDPRVVKAVNWLKAHQDSHDGAWAAASLNTQYEAGSMQIEFMRDAATTKSNYCYSYVLKVPKR